MVSKTDLYLEVLGRAAVALIDYMGKQLLDQPTVIDNKGHEVIDVECKVIEDANKD